MTIVAPTFGVSNYHAAVVKFEKRFGDGFNVLSTYTWAKFLDNAGGGGGVLGDEVNHIRTITIGAPTTVPRRTTSGFAFTFSSVYELTFGQGHKFPGRGLARHIAGGWSIGAVMTVQTAAPFTVTTQTNTTNAFSAGALRADVLRNPNLPSGDRALNRWFDTFAFAQPANYKFGNQGVNIIRGDSRVNFDCSILRKLRVQREQTPAISRRNFQCAESSELRIARAHVRRSRLWHRQYVGPGEADSTGAAIRILKMLRRIWNQTLQMNSAITSRR